MAYICTIAPGQSLYLDEQEAHTIVTLTSSAMGQQQQSSNRYPTGAWTAPPHVMQTMGGVVITLFTHRGNTHIQVQGSAIALTPQSPDLSQAQPIPVQQVVSSPATPASPSPMPSMSPMPSISPMPPMTMGDMSMQMNPMKMRMGNMAMSMGTTPTVSQPNSEAQNSSSLVTPESVTPKSVTPKFCSQCGAGVQEGDRFCSQCGHQLLL